MSATCTEEVHKELQPRFTNVQECRIIAKQLSPKASCADETIL